MSKDANSFGHDKALAWESRGFVYTKKRMHRFDTPSCLYLAFTRYHLIYRCFKNQVKSMNSSHIYDVRGGLRDFRTGIGGLSRTASDVLSA